MVVWSLPFQRRNTLSSSITAARPHYAFVFSCFRDLNLSAGRSLLFADAPQVLIGPQEKLAVGDRDRRVGRLGLAQAIGRQHLILRTGVEDDRRGVARQAVELAVRVDHRAPVRAGRTLLGFPDFLGGLQLVAARRAVVFEDVDVIADDDAAADALVVLRVMPEAVLGDVA